MNRLLWCALWTISATMPFASIYSEPAPASRLNYVNDSPASPTIKVLLGKDMDGAQVEVKGGYTIYDPYCGKQLESAYSGSSFYMYPTTEGLRWGAEFPGVYQILIAPKYGTFLLSGIEYQGMLYAYQIEGALAFVNEISIDDYADAMLSAKIPATFADKEAIAALAIAARTDALHKSMSASTVYFDIKAQAENYQGSGLLRKDIPYQLALQSTKKMVLTKGAQHEKTAGFAIDWFNGNQCTAPLEKIQHLADEGMHAKEILQQLFSDSSVTLER